MKLNCFLLALAVVGCGLITRSTAAGETEIRGFSLVDRPNESLDALLDGRTAVRYMYGHDTSTPAKLIETYKPYLHVFDAEGKQPITKGPGGRFPHHRGIFIGWNRIKFNGKNYDRWHMRGGAIVHQKFSEQRATSDLASFTSVTHWNDETGQPIVAEERTMTIRRAPAPARLMIDFTTALKAPQGEVFLDGDPEHAGIQYRPANEVDTHATVYTFPRENADPRQDRDYPWVAETYTLQGLRHSVVQMNHPDNPKGTIFSAYRDYGRFGAFFKQPIREGETLTLKYRFVIAHGELPNVELIENIWGQFAGVKAQTAIPKLTVRAVPRKEEPK